MTKFRTMLLACVALMLVTVICTTAGPVQGDDAQPNPGLATASDLWRWGLSGMPDPATNWLPDVLAMGIRWYSNWGFKPAAGATGVEFFPMALRSWSPTDECSTATSESDGSIMLSRIASNTYPNGTTWLVGNEVGLSADSSNNQIWTPAEYARRYRKCYRLLKGIEPANSTVAARNFKVAFGGVLPPCSGCYTGGATNGTDWVRKVRAAYLAAYGEAMPVDVYNIHLYGPPPTNLSPAPCGTSNYQGYLYLTGGVNDFRTAMANEWGARDKALIVTEIGVRETVSMASSVCHMTYMIDFFNSAASPTIGNTTDGNRLVQRWAWFTDVTPPYANSSYYGFTNLWVNNQPGVRTLLGNRYADRAYATPTNTPAPSSTATPTRTNTPLGPTSTPTQSPTPTPYAVRVNAGGAAYTDTTGDLWAADKAFAAGNWGYVGGSTYAVAADIINTLDDALYQSERYWATGATPGYRFTVPANGQYEVTLKFAEIYKNAPEKRKFDVRIEGVTVLTAYDIYASAGGKNIAAPDQTFVVNVADGEVTIDFVQIAGFDTPKISAIQVKVTSGGVPPTSTRTATAVPATATRTATSPPGPTATPTRTPTRTATTSAPAYEQRVNAGGAAYTDTAGNAWAADRAFSAGNWGYVGGSTYATTAAIASTEDDPLYQSERYWATGATPGYRFAVPANGQYEVTLKFAEIYKNAAERRKFTVRIEGVTVLSAYDIYASAGGKNIAAPDQTFVVNVTDGEVTIDFIQIAGFDTPKISAIEVQSAGAAPQAPTATPSPTATGVTPSYLVRVNAGGPAYTDSQNRWWQADRPFGSGPWGYDGASAAVGSTTHPIAGTTDDTLYQTDRRWSDIEGTPRYRFAVTNGSYQVTLHFAESEFNAAGQRVFHMKVEGVNRVTNYDIYADVGGDRAASTSLTVVVSDGMLNIVLTAVAGQPKVSAIEVISLQ
jgi:hypothetical protein